MLKAMGNQPFAMGRHASSIDIMAAPEQVAACRWGYQCSVCLLAGDLLCCEVGDHIYMEAKRRAARLGGSACWPASSAARWVTTFFHGFMEEVQEEVLLG